MKQLVFIFTLVSSSFSYAMVWSEYSHLSDAERNEIHSPRLIGSEYESDRLTYQFLNSWNNQWLNEEEIFQYAAGSLGPTRFYTHGRFRFEEDVSKSLIFRLSYFEYGNYKYNRQSLIFEFLYSFNNWLSFSVYGQPSTLKRDDDAGLAAIFHFSKNSSLRLYYTAVDFSYNKRNEDNSTYDEKPSSYGLVWRQTNKEKQEFYELSIKEDTKTRLTFNDTGRVYTFGAKSLSLLSRNKVSEWSWLQSETNYIDSFEGDTVNTDNGITRWEHKALDTMIQLETPTALVNLFGLRMNYSQWNSSSGHVIHNDLLPHMWFHIYRGQSGSQLHDLLLGYEFTWHRAQGLDNLRSTLDTNNNLEHRMNFKYALNVSDETFFNVLLTFDLDDFGTGETWEGGSMQYSMSF